MLLCHVFRIIGVNVVLLHEILVQENLKEVQGHNSDGQKDEG